MGYCEPADLHAFGLPRGVIPSPGRLAGSVSVATNSVELDGHGYDTGDQVQFRAEAGGSLPVPIVEGTTYYAVDIDDAHFQVAPSLGGAVIDLTTAGSRVIVISRLPREAAIEWASRVVDDMIPAAVVPLSAPYPPLVRMTTAELAVWKLGVFSGNNPKSLTEMIDFAQKRLARWAKGVPVRGVNAPAPANLSASAAAFVTDSRGWSRYGGIR